MGLFLLYNEHEMKPTRIAILADIHGTVPSLLAVMDDLQSHVPDEIIIAGDFLGGPQPKETLTLLKSLDPLYILGNGEANLLKMHHGTAPQAWWQSRQFDTARWFYSRLDPGDFAFLETLPQHWVVHPEGSEPLRVVHGAPWDINKLVFPHKEPEVFQRALEAVPEDVLVFAHTHLPEILRRDGKLAINPGAVGNNLNGDTRASYATLTWTGEGWAPELHFVAHDLRAVVEVFQDTGFLEATRPLSRAFLESILTGENTALDYIHYAYKQAEAQGYRNLGTVPDDIWLAAESSFPWKYDL